LDAGYIYFTLTWGLQCVVYYDSIQQQSLRPWALACREGLRGAAAFGKNEGAHLSGIGVVSISRAGLLERKGKEGREKFKMSL